MKNNISFWGMATLTCFIFGACATSSVSLQVLKPAQITLPSYVQKVAVINRSLPSKEEKVNNIIEGVFSGEGLFVDREASKKCIDGMLNFMVNSPRLKAVEPVNIDLRGTGTAEFPMPLDWTTVEKICKDNGCDALLSLETFDSDKRVSTRFENKTKSENGQNIPYTQWFARMDMQINAGWRIYDPKQKQVIFKDVLVDTRSWNTDALVEKEALSKLPQPRNATIDAGYFAGEQTGFRISPAWIYVSRSYYVRGNDQLKQTKRFVRANKWEEASKIWTSCLNDPKRKAAGRACYNLALAAEMDGDLAKGVEMAKKAYTQYGNKKARYYMNILENRQMDAQKLKEQMNAK
ncbi:MAG: DUF6340 family protein [Bacteroidota bacterium]